MAEADKYSVQVRYIAGVCLKSVLSRQSIAIDEDTQKFLEEKLPKTFIDESNLISRASKLSIVSLIMRNKILGSEKLIAFLIEAIKYKNQILLTNFSVKEMTDKLLTQFNASLTFLKI